MHCEEIRSLFADHLTDSLDEAYRFELDRHLFSCESCREELDGIRAMWTRLASASIDEPDSNAMRSRFGLTLTAYRQGMDQRPANSWRGALAVLLGQLRPSRTAIEAAIAMVLLVLGVAIGRSIGFPPERSNQDLVELRTELHDMRQMFAISLMQQQSATERLRGVSWSNQIDQPDATVLSALLDTLMHDPNVNVRLASVDALKKFGQEQMVRSGALQALGRQDSPLVQVALIDLMVELQEKDSTDALRRLTQDASADMSVRDRAAWGLEQLE